MTSVDFEIHAMKTRLMGIVGLLLIAAGPVRSDIITSGAWCESSPELGWMVTGPVDGYWTYEYWWNNDASPALSHLTIEVSPGAQLDEFRNFEGSNNGIDFAPLDPAGVELATYSPSPIGSQPNPGMPEDLFGIKFDGTDFFGVNRVHIRFETMLGPVPGDFFAKGGSSGAYNDGFTVGDTDPAGGVPLAGVLPDPGQAPQHIIRPNGAIGPNGAAAPVTRTPEATSIAIWCVVAFSYAGAYCWRRRRPRVIA